MLKTLKHKQQGHTQHPTHLAVETYNSKLSHLNPEPHHNPTPKQRRAGARRVQVLSLRFRVQCSAVILGALGMHPQEVPFIHSQCGLIILV